MKFFKVVALVGAVMLVGCAGQSGTSDDSSAGDGSDGAVTSGVDDQVVGQTFTLPDGRVIDVMQDRTVYFEFDSTELDSASKSFVKAHGEFLAANPDLKVRLEGHADERGSREYNIGLGERRAVVVQEVLLVQGGDDEQVTTVSFGEERPADDGTSESSYALNRR